MAFPKSRRVSQLFPFVSATPTPSGTSCSRFGRRSQIRAQIFSRIPDAGHRASLQGRACLWCLEITIAESRRFDRNVA